jgi:hypothetical protein
MAILGMGSAGSRFISPILGKKVTISVPVRQKAPFLKPQYVPLIF